MTVEQFFFLICNNNNCYFVFSNISIPNLNSNHTGKYDCKLNSSSGTRTQSISLTVISNKTKFCGVGGNITLQIYY